MVGVPALKLSRQWSYAAQGCSEIGNRIRSFDGPEIVDLDRF